MKRLLAIFLAVVLTLALSTVLPPAQPTLANSENVVYVDVSNDGYEDGSEANPFNTIQEGINAALSGDTVEVDPGTYNENIVMKSQVIIRGSGAYATTINGTGAGSVVVATFVELAELDGFTITNGIAEAEGGGGILVHWYSSPTISNCIITGNSAPYGGGIWINDYSSPTIKNCIIAGNEATHTEMGYGGGILSSSFSTPTVVNCTITGNSAEEGGGIANIATFLIPVTNSIIWGNTTDSGPNIYNVGVRVPPTFSYCDIEGCGGSGEGWVSSFGTDGGNNIDDDPLFVDPVEGDYHLQLDSPCLDTGTGTGAPDFDLDGVERPQGAEVDMGAYERPAGSVLVDIDIKPGSDPNSINPSSKGVIPVAILTTANFDATTVDPDTVIFGPGGAVPIHTAIEDVDDDGDNDMILHFKTQEVGFNIEDTEATLTGQTVDDQEITGTDSVNIVPPKGKGKK